MIGFFSSKFNLQFKEYSASYKLIALLTPADKSDNDNFKSFKVPFIAISTNPFFN